MNSKYTDILKQCPEFGELEKLRSEITAILGKMDTNELAGIKTSMMKEEDEKFTEVKECIKLWFDKYPHEKEIHAYINAKHTNMHQKIKGCIAMMSLNPELRSDEMAKVKDMMEQRTKELRGIMAKTDDLHIAISKFQKEAEAKEAAEREERRKKERDAKKKEQNRKAQAKVVSELKPQPVKNDGMEVVDLDTEAPKKPVPDLSKADRIYVDGDTIRMNHEIGKLLFDANHLTFAVAFINKVYPCIAFSDSYAHQIDLSNDGDLIINDADAIKWVRNVMRDDAEFIEVGIEYGEQKSNGRSYIKLNKVFH